MPVLFIGHGSPMNIIEENSYTRSLVELGRKLPKPKAVLVISAHWQTRKPQITAAKNPPTIYDFYGFPKELYQATYLCPGSPELVLAVLDVTKGEVVSEEKRGIDHAAWAVLTHMYPAADIPVCEMSLDVLKSPQEHYELAKKLAPLREQGFLILGSGNIVHNLSRIDFANTYGAVYPWAQNFDQLVAEELIANEHKKLIDYESLPEAALAVPTNEHYLPMLYAIALQQNDEKVDFICTDMQNGSIAMRSFMITVQGGMES